MSDTRKMAEETVAKFRGKRSLESNADMVDAIEAALNKIDRHHAEHCIITQYEYPPIPIRQFDWCAYRDDYEPPDSDGVGGGLIGWGRTEAEAIKDLLDHEDEDKP